MKTNGHGRVHDCAQAAKEKYEKIIIAAAVVFMVFGSGARALFPILPAEYDTLRWCFDFRRRRSTLGKLQ
jgi:hypothetical protein